MDAHGTEAGATTRDKRKFGDNLAGWRWAQRDMLLQNTGGHQNNRERKADGSCLLGVGRLTQPKAITSNGRDLGRANMQGGPRKLSTRARAARAPPLPPRGSRVRPRPLVPYLTGLKRSVFLLPEKASVFFLS